MNNKIERSFWTGKKGNDLVSMSTDFLPLMHRPKEIIYVENKYQEKVKSTLLWVSRSLPFFYIAIFLGCFLAPIFVAVGNMFIGGILVMIMGVGIFAFPFTTYLTMQIFGLRNALLMGRVAGVLLILVGFIAIRS